MKKLFYNSILVLTLLLAGCADAGKDQVVHSGDLVTLNASGSTPSVGGVIEKYRWKQVRGTHVSLSDRESVQPTFVAPEVNIDKILIFKLVTVEHGGKVHKFKSHDYIHVTVKPSQRPNEAPIANIRTSTTTIEEGETLTFDAYASHDEDGFIVSYEWTDDNSSVLSTNIIFEKTFDKAGIFTYTLLVTDDKGLTGTDTIEITVEENQTTVNIGDWNRTNPGAGGAFSSIGGTANGKYLIAGSDLSGLYISTDKGRTWEPRGETHGLKSVTVQALGYHQSNDEIFYVGTIDSIYKTSNGGNTFVKLDMSKFDNNNGILIESITVGQDKLYVSLHDWNYDSSSIITSATIGSENEWSDDLSLAMTNNKPIHSRFVKLMVHPTDDSHIYALSGQARFGCSIARAFISTDAGGTWSNIIVDNNASKDIFDFDLDIRNKNKLYVSTFKSFECEENIGAGGYVDSNASKEHAGKFHGIYLSKDKGISFNKIDDNNITGTINVSTKNGNNSVVIVNPISMSDYWRPNETGSWKSISGEGNFTYFGSAKDWDLGHIKNYAFALSYSYYGIQETITKDIFNSDFMYGTYGFNSISKDGGKIFTNVATKEDPISPDTWRSTGLDNIIGMAIDVSDSDTDVVYMGATDIGFWYSRNHGKSWEISLPHDISTCRYIWDRSYEISGKAILCNGQEIDTKIYNYDGGANVATLINDPNNKEKVWTTFSSSQSFGGAEHNTTTGVYTELTGLFKKDTFDGNWQLITEGIPTSESINEHGAIVNKPNGRMYGLSLDKNTSLNNRTLYMTINGHVYKSTNDGIRWEQKTSSNTANNLESCGLFNNTNLNILNDNQANGCGLKVTAVSKEGRIVYAGGESGLWRSLNKGDTWERIGNINGTWVMEANNTRGSNMIKDYYPTYRDPGSALYLWEGIFDIKTDPLINDRVYVTVYSPLLNNNTSDNIDNNGGLYRSDDAGLTWTKQNLPQVNTSRPNKHLRGIAIDPNNSKIIFVSASTSYNSGGEANQSVGIIYSDDTGETWESTNNNMAWKFGGMMEVENTTTQNPRIWAWSEGTGLQYAEIIK